MADRRDNPGTASSGLSLESTASLLAKVRIGDEPARERLVERYLRALQRWARGRLPRFARDLSDTDDLVQITFLRALDHVDRFEHRKPGSFLAYLRQILLNEIRSQIRRAAGRPGVEGLDDEQVGQDPSPLEQAIGKEALDTYEAALAELPLEQQEAVILRVELGFTNPEVAQALGSPSTNAARMKVVRALVRLAEVMNERSRSR